MPHAFVPPPADPAASVPVLVRELAGHTGIDHYVSVCVDLLDGGPREQYLPELAYLSGHPIDPASPILDSTKWKDYWLRTWGARGLLHVWADAAGERVLAGVRDDHWRPVEMCLKVIARHQPADAGDAAVAVAGHENVRVRIQVLRALAVTGDTEHLGTVEGLRNDDQPAVRRTAESVIETMRARLDVQ